MTVVDLKARLLGEARAAIRAGDWTLAVPLLDRLTRIGRDDAETVKFAHVSLAAHYFERGDGRRSVEHFRAALSIDPTDDRVLYCLGHAHLDAEQFPEAAEAFGRVVSTHPTDAEYLRSWGVALAAAGRVVSALAALKAAAREKPDEPIVLKDLAQLLASLGRFPEAMRLIRRACALAPGEPFFREVLDELRHEAEVARLLRSFPAGTGTGPRRRRS